MVHASVFYGSVKDSEFSIVFNELALLTGSLFKDFNYCVEESVYISSSDKLLLIKDLVRQNQYIQKMNPPEPWDVNEPNVISFNKLTSTDALNGYTLTSTLRKIGYSFTFNSMEILIHKVVVNQEIQEYTSDPLKYNSILKNLRTILRAFVPDLGSVDHTLLRLKVDIEMGKYGEFVSEQREKKLIQKDNKEIIIPRTKRTEISDESWNKTLERALTITLNTQSRKNAVVLSPNKNISVENNTEISKYLQELGIKNQKLLKSTNESLNLYQEIKKIEMSQSKEETGGNVDKNTKISTEISQKVTPNTKESTQIKKNITESTAIPKEITQKENGVKQKENDVKQKENDVKQKENNVKQTLASALTLSKSNAGFHAVDGKVVSEQAYKEGDVYIQKIFQVKKSKQEMNTQFIFKGKMNIRTRCGQFMNLQPKVIEIAKVISSLLEEGKKESSKTKQVVKQAQTEIAVKKDLAFPIAIFCCMLMEKHADFKEYLIGKMMTKCPYIVPMYIKKGTSTDAEYRKNLGYVKKEDGSYETEIQYEERMCGVLCLYAAIVQTTALPHSYGIEYGWKWLSRILNLPVRRITAILILTFIETAGYEMYKKYPTQMPKIMTLLSEEVIPKMPDASVASITRLQLFLEDTITKTGSIPEPFGKHLKRR